MSNKEVKQKEGLMERAHISMKAWIDELMCQEGPFVLTADLAKLTVPRPEFAVLFGISLEVQEELSDKDASILVTRHGEGWTVTAVKLDEALGRKQVTALKRTYLLLLEYIQLHYGEIDLHLLREKAVSLYNSLPPATQEEVINPHIALSIIPELE